MMITNDPVRDAERYAAEADEADRKCLHCALCEGTIWDGDDYYEIDDMVMCPDCLRDEFKKVACYD